LFQTITYSFYQTDNATGANLVEENKSKTVLKFATAYGFKNIQCILQRLSKDARSTNIRAANEYDYIEVMACPRGCLNGGGQIQGNFNLGDVSELGTSVNLSVRETPAETRLRVEKNLFYMSCICDREFKETSPLKLYHAESVKMLHTRFHAVPKIEYVAGNTAGITLDDTKW